jgi:hypothetical protein
VVILGSLLVLEASKDDLKLSTVLELIDSNQVRVYRLISQPCCEPAEIFR